MDTDPGGPGPAAVPPGLRVLVVDERLREDGATRLWLGLAGRWAAAGVRVAALVVHPRVPGDGSPGPPDGVRLLGPRAGSDRRDPLSQLLGLLRGLLAAVRPARGADVVLAAREIDTGLLVGRLVTLLVRRPFVVLVQSDPAQAMAHHVHPRLRPALTWCLRTADRVVCVSPGLVEPLVALGVPAGRTVPVPNGVDVGRVAQAGRRPPPDLAPGDGPLVVGAGRLVRQKGFDLLVRAHARVVHDGVPHRLLVLGQGGERQQLLDLAEELGVSGSVTLAGFVPDPLPVMAAADLFCLPSRWEGFGLTLAEALVVGTPVVAADCVSGPRWLLADGAHGDLVPVDDVDALADAIGAHLREPDRLRRAAAVGQAWAREHLDERRSSDGVLAVLSEAATAAGRGDRPARRR